MKQLTEIEAITLYNSGIWKQWSDEQIIRCQLFQERVCIDWESFLSAMFRHFGRRIHTHEISPELQAEFLGNKASPTLDEIINLLPPSIILAINID